MKMMKLERSGKKINIASYGKKNIPTGIIQKGLMAKEQDFIRLVKEGVEEISGKKLRTKWVVVSVPERETFLRVVQLPLMKDEDIKRAIKWGAEENIPLNIDEAYFDWEKIPPPPGKSPPGTKRCTGRERHVPWKGPGGPSPATSVRGSGISSCKNKGL